MINAEKGTGFYNLLKDTKVEVMPYWGLEGKMALLDDRIQFTFIGRDDYTFWGTKWEWDFLPRFSDTRARVKNGINAEVSANITNDCIIPDTVGFSLFDENNNRIGEPQWNNQKYWKHDSFSFPFMTTFTNLATNKKYKAYPTLRLFNFNVLASPSADLNMELPVKITDFKQTGSQYKKNGFTYDGRTYSYKYDVAVTVELTDAEGVEDWGYAYLDPNGQESHISLKYFESPYTDERYVYYRNEDKSTVTLYEYVKYEGEQDYVYGEPIDYEVSHRLTYCPDSNHPHLIDLGLPSGTKWACCNVGATTPEDYGGYYAWGETEKKTDYNWRTYEHCDGSYSTCYNLGSNIAGSDYDVALVNWGGSWCMPTSEQFKELIDNCTHEWIEYNGFYGRKFTGTNGNSIFLPAAGDRYDSKLYDTGSKGYYWSDTLYPEENSQAYYLNLDNESENVRILNGYRYYGHSVRPVVK